MANPRLTQATRKKTPDMAQESFSPNAHLREIIFILAVALGALLFTTILSFQEVGFTSFGGAIGQWLAQALFDFFGYSIYLLPVAMIYGGWLFFRAKEIFPEHDYAHAGWRVIGLVLSLIGLNSVLCLAFRHSLLHNDAGGYFGMIFGLALAYLIGSAASICIFVLSFLIGVTLFTGLSWLSLVDFLGKISLMLCVRLMHLAIKTKQFISEQITNYLIHRKALASASAVSTEALAKFSTPPRKSRAASISAALNASNNTAQKIEPMEPRKEPIQITPQKVRKDRQKSLFPLVARGEGLPSLELLDPSSAPTGTKITADMLEQISRDVEARLQDFGVAVQVVAVHPGPVVTRYEMQLAPGIKVSKITSLAKDLARSLSVTSVRIVEVIPGKTTVGLEVPNENRQIVRLSEVFSSQQYEQANSMLSLALGKDISGNPVVVDLVKMPHLLVAGTTGSGKSVGINAMILSLLYKATPADVRMIMIDPKMLELSIYEGIPHLLTPVVTDMKEAANALRWCVAEMDRRYKIMAALGVRNLAGYNQKIKDAEKAGAPIMDPLWRPGNQLDETPQALTTLPFVVVLIDEFADMMMVVGKKVEELIARIAQKARAAGIHMILATQRPSVDVITGLIKANIPARIAFQVSSRIDSRTILDQQGAEQLLGNGDMLYLTPGSGVPIRIHGAFVSDQEVHAVVTDWKARGEPEYIEQITQTTETGEGIDGDESAESDPLYDQAVQIVLESRKASISNIQRRLKIGYNRAARLIESMEVAGLVSAMENNGTREVLAQAN